MPEETIQGTPRNLNKANRVTLSSDKGCLKIMTSTNMNDLSKALGNENYDC